MEVAETWRGEALGSGPVCIGHYGTRIDPRTLNLRFTLDATWPVT